MLSPTIFYRRGVAYARLFIGKSPLRLLYPHQRFVVRVLGPMDAATARLYGSSWALSELIKAKAMSNDVISQGLTITAGGITVDTRRPEDLKELDELGLREKFFKAVEENLRKESSPHTTSVASKGPTLGQVITKYLEQKLPNIDSKRQKQTLKFMFEELLPSIAGPKLDEPVDVLDHIWLKDVIMMHLEILPANVKNSAKFRHHFQDGGSGMVGVWSSLQSGEVKETEYEAIGPRTIDKHVETIQAFWRVAALLYKVMPPNPFFIVKKQANKIALADGRVITKRPFTDEELATIFGRLDFNRSWKKWITLIALFTGARVNEIAQLTAADVVEEGGCHAFRFTDEGEGQSIKTDASRRKVPIPAKLVELGLVAYCDSVQGANTLFPDLNANPKYSKGKPVSRWFNRAIRSIGIVDDAVTFHSFRHTVSTRLSHAGVGVRDISDITGHVTDGADKSVLSRQYIAPKRLLELKAIMDNQLIYNNELFVQFVVDAA